MQTEAYVMIMNYDSKDISNYILLLVFTCIYNKSCNLFA
jgi:hypothetical protein